MKDMTIEEFCDKHSACAEGRKWAISNYSSMQEAWSKLNPDWLIWVATREGVLTDKELRLFAVWSARQVQYLMKDKRSLDALDVAERYANGLATSADLAEARDAAWDAARAAARAHARASARASAWAAARAEARDAAWDAAWDAARAAARAEARDAAWDAAWDAQAKWLRENTKPNFNTKGNT